MRAKSIRPNHPTLLAATAVALLLPLTPAWAAAPVYLALEIDGNEIQGESTVVSLDREGTIECLSYTEEVFTPRDATSGQLTDRRRYLPITITKRVDGTSPLLVKALAQNEPVNQGVFKFFRPNPNDGTEQHYFTVQILNGYVSSIRRISPDVLDPVTANRPAMEEISFVYQTITWTSEIGGATHTDTAWVQSAN